MIYEEKREEQRQALKVKAFYERVSHGKTQSLIPVLMKDINLSGISFYSDERINLNTELKFTLFVSRNESIAFKAKVVRSDFHGKTNMNYIIGINIEDLDDEKKIKLKDFMDKTDISSILDNIDMTNVIDVNFVVGYPPVIKKLDKLFIWGEQIYDDYIMENLLLSMLDEDRYLEFMKNKELNLIYTSRKRNRFRVNLHIQQQKVEGTFRIIPSTIESPSSLGLPEVTENLLEDQRGLILVAGRTGAGKSTSLAAMIEYINNRRSGIIITVENPIEYIHENKKCIIKQREIGRDTLSYYNAAKNALRQNPDILLVGEILDMETMETAITAAETGTLVLTSIHAGNCSQALDRVATFFPADMQKHILRRLSLVLKGVVGQELIPRLDNRGLVLATEVLIVNSAVRQCIRNASWQQVRSLIQVNRRVGMQTMENSLEELQNKGLISEEYIKEET
jgi:twitching motility protein PilT